MKLAITIFALCLLLPVAAFADESNAEKNHDHEESHSKHALALFAGVTKEDGEYLDTLGIEYAYRVDEKWSLGAVIERADRDKNSTLVIAFAHYWPYKGLFLGLGLGRKDPGDERENTARVTIGYEFELKGGWSIAPQANLDVIKNHENEEVYGIAFGKRF
jgi:hypothetical protein